MMIDCEWGCADTREMSTLDILRLVSGIGDKASGNGAGMLREVAERLGIDTEEAGSWEAVYEEARLTLENEFEVTNEYVIDGESYIIGRVDGEWALIHDEVFNPSEVLSSSWYKEDMLDWVREEIA